MSKNHKAIEVKEAVEVLAAGLLLCLDVPNCSQFTLDTPDGPFVLTIQRVNGKPPLQLMHEERARLIAAFVKHYEEEACYSEGRLAVDAACLDVFGQDWPVL